MDLNQPAGGVGSVGNARMATLVDRLAVHRALSGVPRAQLEWLAAHGEVRCFAPGEIALSAGEIPDQLVVVFAGRLSVSIERGGNRRRVMDWWGGDITGMLPYSRMTKGFGDTVVDEPTEVLAVGQAHFPEMMRECQELTAILVHLMIDRARHFTSQGLQDEKMRSLGRLSAGLAHELNNPASAVARSAASLGERVAELTTAARSLGAAGLSAGQTAAVDRVAVDCLRAAELGVRSPVEQAEREDALADWLAAHRADPAAASALAESEVTLGALDALAAAVGGPGLDAALRAIAASCTVSALAGEIEAAATRISHLVSAVKGFTHMDQAMSAAPVDLARNLADTVALHQSRARAKSIGITVDVDPDLPRVLGFGGELNQVWANLIENALDAAPVGGRVTVSARGKGNAVTVSIEDDGPGVPDDLRARIFEPFFTTKPVGSGAGLGLDIVQRIVDDHRGEIALESRPGRTVFTVTLPLR
jgi:signal transduction histidine kinase